MANAILLGQTPTNVDSVATATTASKAANGTLTGSNNDYLRNIIISAVEPFGTIANGTIWIVYE